MFDQDIIERISSAWTAQVVLIKKLDNSVRFCFDYRKLNYVTKKDAYSLSKINGTLVCLSAANYFCTLAFSIRLLVSKNGS